MTKYQIYTDGGCRGNGKAEAVGAWAFIVYDYSGNRVGSKSEANIGWTNNQNELTAILKATEWANKHKHNITISTDSNYCKQGCESWAWSWKQKNWKKSDGGIPENLDIWKTLISNMEAYKDIHGEIPTFVKVKGHSGDPMNNEVDALVNVKMTELEMENM